MELGPGPSRKRRRGIQQRLETLDDELTQSSALHFLLMTLLAQGVLSGALCHSIAQAAKKDFDAIQEGKKLSDIEQLANLKHGKNLVRSVYGNLSKASTLPEPLAVQMPFSDGNHPGSILLPHEYFAYMFEHEMFWKKTIMSNEDSLQRFWSTFEKHPCMKASPILKVKDYQKYMVPLALHGDEVPCYGVGKIWARSVLAFSWNSIVANLEGGQQKNIMNYTWGCFEKFVQKDAPGALGTMSVFFQILAWSFQCLFHGKWPSTDWRNVPFDPQSVQGKKAGKPLAGPYKAALLQLCGDLDYFHKWIGIPQSQQHQKPCCLCRATFEGASSWLDNRPTSQWQNLLLTAANWKGHWQSNCALLSLPGANCWTVALDFMHNFYLGWLQFLYGSVICLLVQDCLEDNQLTNLKTLASFLKQYQKEDRSRGNYRPRLDKLSMFLKRGFPKLKGRAADIRSLDKALLAAWNTWMTPTDEQHQQISVLLQLNVSVRDLLDNYSPKFGYSALPPAIHQQVVTQAFQMSQLHVQLMEFYKAQERQVFNITSKTHFCLHSLLLADCVHPHLTWCFKGEAQMKTVQTLWKSCLVGNKHYQCCQTAALKYRHLLFLRNQE